MKGNIISKRSICCMFTFLAVMMIVGSFFDYSISRAFYNEESAFGRFLAAYGEYPAAIGFTYLGRLL